jgi:hypothetical protein
MANTSINYQQFFIQGDGVSLTAVIQLQFLPTSATFMSASIFGGADISANVTSVVLSGATLTVTFISPISGIITLLMNFVYSAFQPVVFATPPPVVLYAGSTAASACSFKFINASGAAVSVKASAGNLYGVTLTNNTAAIAFVEFFNTAGVPVLGTTAVTMAFEIPASGVLNIPPSVFALGNFVTGIGFACTTAENGVTTASVTGVIWTI